jgi:hypothetical protein
MTLEVFNAYIAACNAVAFNGEIGVEDRTNAVCSISEAAFRSLDLSPDEKIQLLLKSNKILVDIFVRQVKK